MPAQAYFDDIRSHVSHELHKATSSIQIAVPCLTDSGIFNHLCQKAGEGVRVELIVVKDDINRRNGIEYKRLTELGGLFLMESGERKKSAIMHNKFCVIDGTTIITGSYSWSKRPMEDWENIILIEDYPDLARQFVQEFKAICEQYVGSDNQKQAMVYSDIEIQELTLELKTLEIQIIALEDEKAEVEKTLFTFNHRYNIEVGEIVRKILKLRQERLKRAAENDAGKRSSYEEAKQDYQEFEQGYQQAQRERFTITEAERQELKTIFRACSKMCHPDVVAKEYEEKATTIFAELSVAYEKNDIAAVKEIHERLRKGIFTTISSTVRDAQKLRLQVIRLRGKVKDLAIAIYQLRKTDAWHKVTGIGNEDAYFAQLKQQLQAELDRLEVQ